MIHVDEKETTVEGTSDTVDIIRLAKTGMSMEEAHKILKG